MHRIRLGMVGGGTDAFIGAVHRMASRLDGQFELVAGALSSTEARARASGAALGLDPARSYGSFEEMAEVEQGRPDRIEAVAIVTPNDVHFPAAQAFLRRGVHVICDKPLTATQSDATALQAAVEASDALFVLTHNYTGYPMIRQARAMVAEGDLGALRVVQVEYAQDWMSAPVERENLKQAQWRTDPARSGAGGSVGDIGTHAHNLACFVTGRDVMALSADLHSFGEGRRLDDNAHVMLRFEDGLRGMLWCSQVAPGNANGLRLRLYGTRGGIEWAQEDPDVLWFTLLGAEKRLIRRGGARFHPAAQSGSRLPQGHPEGYLEGFANIYAEAATAIRAVQAGHPRAKAMGLLPGIDEGMAGMAFIDACVRSSQEDGVWITL